MEWNIIITEYLFLYILATFSQEMHKGHERNKKNSNISI